MLILCGICWDKLKIVVNSDGIVMGSGDGLVRWLWGFYDGRDDRWWLVGMGGKPLGVWVKWL